MIYNLLSIAGSDPSGGAGLQADLKTFSALGCYGMTAITALTAQNTMGVRGVFPVPADFIRAQLDAVFEDIHVHGIKIGMLGDPAAIIAIADALRARAAEIPIVLDPVMVAQSGDRLVTAGAVTAMKEHLIPLARVITPNLPEGEVLLGRAVADQTQAAQDLLALGARAVLLKGGHAEGDVAQDVLAHAGGTNIFTAPRLPTKNTHGTGCTLAAALACFLAMGHDLPESCARAKDYLTGALAAADRLDVGRGAGPVHHFHALWPATKNPHKKSA